MVREAQPGERNNRLNWAAYTAGSHAARGELDAEQAADELLLAATAVGLDADEAVRTICSGIEAGMAA